MIRRSICLALLALMACAVAPTRAGKIDIPDNAITVKVGQVLYIAFTADGDNLVSPRMFPAASDTEPMVTVQLQQNGPTRTLLITNGYEKGLNYRGVARIRGRRREVELPVSTVRGGQQSVLTLGEPFDELLLFEFHLSS